MDIKKFCINPTLNNFNLMSNDIKYFIYYIVKVCLVKNIGDIDLAKRMLGVIELTDLENVLIVGKEI